MSAPQTDVRVGRAVRARGLGIEYLIRVESVSSWVAEQTPISISTPRAATHPARVRVSFGWPHGVTYAVAQMGVFPDFVTALNFAVWADKAEAARLSRGGEAGNRFGAGDDAELAAPVA